MMPLGSLLKDTGTTSPISVARMLALSWAHSSSHGSAISRCPQSGQQHHHLQLQEPLQPGWGRWGLSIIAAVSWPAPKKRRRTYLAVSKRRAELLVDADYGGIYPIMEAMEKLRKEGFRVCTTVYAEPGRRNNKKWHQLFQQSGVAFTPIPRNKDGEATDTAIEEQLVQLAQSKDDICIALLTCDTDFFDQVQLIASLRKKDMWVFVPTGGPASISPGLRRYKETEAHVVPLATSAIQAEQHRRGQGTKVRATLEPDGHGSVSMAEPCRPSHLDQEDLDQLRAFLHELGYCDEGDERTQLLQSVAKFWFVNRLGPLTVFPTELAFGAACELLQASRRSTSWACYHNDHAFFLPIRTSGSNNDKTLREYGGKNARRVFRGGGPFMLEDSAGMVAKALQRLGYLDEGLSNDLPEALFLFVNRPEHKATLRKRLDALPVSSDTAVDVEHKIKNAFLSNLTSGKWVVAPSDIEVRKTLCKQGFLKTTKASQPQVLKAMRRFGRGLGLREMRSYNGYVYIIQQHMYNRCPVRVGNIEFKI
ncbi:unnamed protein product [Symbiodinium sp. CCMP2592]|nr:unnamed protein product [Symbiodinium sp. CCMP2592]